MTDYLYQTKKKMSTVILPAVDCKLTARTLSVWRSRQGPITEVEICSVVDRVSRKKLVLDKEKLSEGNARRENILNIIHLDR